MWKENNKFFFSKIIDYSTYQRWFIEINKQHDILKYKMNDELYSKSMINNEKQTSVAKLVNQLCFFSN